MFARMAFRVRVCSLVLLVIPMGCGAENRAEEKDDNPRESPTRSNDSKLVDAALSDDSTPHSNTLEDGDASTLHPTDASVTTDEEPQTDRTSASIGVEGETQASRETQSTSSTLVTNDAGDGETEPPPPPYEGYSNTYGYCGATTTQMLLDEAGEPREPAEPLSEELVAGSVCNATIRTYPTGSSHVTPCTQVDYNSNPPSSGMHYYPYPRYGVYSTPLPRGFWVHLLEHGGVTFMYSCADCTEEVEQAKVMVETTPLDDLCCPDGVCPSSASNRLTLTADSGIETRWAASAWGVTLTADCFEPEVFQRFADERRGVSGIENICGNGGAMDISQPPP